MTLQRSQGVEQLLLLGLGLNLGDQGTQVRRVLRVRCPLVLGEQLVRQTALHGASHAENPVVSLLLGESLEGELDGLGLFGDQVIGSGRQLSVGAGSIGANGARAGV